MSCPSPRPEIISALKRSADGEIQKARMNVEVYLHNPVGSGEHPDILAAIQEQLDIIAHQEERVQIIDKYFANHNHE